MLLNLFANIIRVKLDLLIRKADDLEPSFLQPLLPQGIIFDLSCLCMVSSIHFNDEFLRKTDEVHDEISNDILPSESLPQGITPNHVPQHPFCFRHVLSILLGKSF